MYKVIIVIALGLTLTSCASYSQMMVGPQGETIRCSSWGYGIIGMGTATRIQKDCIRSHRQLGFIEIEKLGIVGIQLSKDSPPMIVRVIKDSPAEKSGFSIGDKVIGIDGHKIERMEEAMPLLIGKPGSPIEIILLREGVERKYRIIRDQYIKVVGKEE